MKSSKWIVGNTGRSSSVTIPEALENSELCPLCHQNIINQLKKIGHTILSIPLIEYGNAYFMLRLVLLYRVPFDGF